MEKLDGIFVKCPVCLSILRVDDYQDPDKKILPCPICHTERKLTEYKRLVPKPKPAPKPAPAPAVDDPEKTRIQTDAGAASATAGCFVDKTTLKRYPLQEGIFTLGRKPSKEPIPDIPIETTDRGMSRRHLKVRVVRGMDGLFLVYVSNDQNKNSTYVNGELLRKGDEVGLKHKDIVKLNVTELEFEGADIEDKTLLNKAKKAAKDIDETMLGKQPDR